MFYMAIIPDTIANLKMDITAYTTEVNRRDDPARLTLFTSVTYQVITNDGFNNVLYSLGMVEYFVSTTNPSLDNIKENGRAIS